MAKRKAKQAEQIDGPTPEQESRSAFVRQIQPGQNAAPKRRVPVIDELFDKGLLTEKQFKALAYYSDQANIADHSPVRSCCDNSPRGGHGPGVSIMSAMLETGRMERDMGQLADIARAVCVDGRSLAQWCIEKHGGRERYDGKGKFIAVVPVGEVKNMRIARMELRMAAGRITGAR